MEDDTRGIVGEWIKVDRVQLMLGNLLFSILFGAAGIVLTALVWYVTYLVLVFLLHFVFDTSTWFVWAVLAVLATVFVFLLYWENWRFEQVNRWVVDRLPGPVSDYAKLEYHANYPAPPTIGLLPNPYWVMTRARIVTVLLFCAPKLSTASLRRMSRFRRLYNLDGGTCAALINSLLTSPNPIPEESLRQELPPGETDWESAKEQLRLFDGVLFHKQPESRLGLTSDFREELQTYDVNQNPATKYILLLPLTGLILALLAVAWFIVVTLSTPIVTNTDKGKASLERKDYDNAVYFFEKATEDNPKDINAWLGWSKALLGQGKPDSALAKLEFALELSQAREPDNVELLKLLASCQESAIKPDKALETWRRILKLQPNDPEALKGIERNTTPAK